MLLMRPWQYFDCYVTKHTQDVPLLTEYDLEYETCGPYRLTQHKTKHNWYHYRSESYDQHGTTCGTSHT